MPASGSCGSAISLACRPRGGGDLCLVHSLHPQFRRRGRRPMSTVRRATSSFTPDGKSPSYRQSDVEQHLGGATRRRTVAAEIPVSRTPRCLALTPDGTRLLVTTSFGGELIVFDRRGERLTRAGGVHLGFEPWGVAVSPDGKRAYVALASGPRWPSSIWNRSASLPGSTWAAGRDTSPSRRTANGWRSASTAMAGLRSSTRSRSSAYSWKTSSASTSARCSLGGRQVRLFPVDQLPPPADHRRQHPPGLGARQPDRPGAAGPAGPAGGDRAGQAGTGRRRSIRSGAEPGRAVALLCRLRFARIAGLTGSAELPWQDYGGPGDHVDEKLARRLGPVLPHPARRPADDGPHRPRRPARLRRQLSAQLHPGRRPGEAGCCANDLPRRTGRAVAWPAGAKRSSTTASGRWTNGTAVTAVTTRGTPMP